MQSLPIELSIEIVKRLAARAIYNIFLVNKHFNELVNRTDVLTILVDKCGAPVKSFQEFMLTCEIRGLVPQAFKHYDPTFYFYQAVKRCDLEGLKIPDNIKWDELSNVINNDSLDWIIKNINVPSDILSTYNIICYRFDLLKEYNVGMLDRLDMLDDRVTRDKMYIDGIPDEHSDIKKYWRDTPKHNTKSKIEQYTRDMYSVNMIDIIRFWNENSNTMVMHEDWDFEFPDQLMIPALMSNLPIEKLLWIEHIASDYIGTHVDINRHIVTNLNHPYMAYRRSLTGNYPYADKIREMVERFISTSYM